MSDVTEAILGSIDATLRLRNMKMIANATPATAALGHMPFPGHRTMDTVWKLQAAARRRQREAGKVAMEYGFDPDSLKASER